MGTKDGNADTQQTDCFPWSRENQNQIMIDYLDVYDAIKDSGGYPSVKKVHDAFPYSVSYSVLGDVRRKLVDLGDIVTEGKAFPGRKCRVKECFIDEDYEAYGAEYVAIYYRLIDSKVRPSIERVRANFSVDIPEDRVAALRRHLLERGELVRRGGGVGVREGDNISLERLAKRVNAARRLVQMIVHRSERRSPQGKLVANSETLCQKEVSDYRRAWRNISKINQAAVGSQISYEGVEKRTNKKYSAHFNDKYGVRHHIGTFETAIQAYGARRLEIERFVASGGEVAQSQGGPVLLPKYRQTGNTQRQKTNAM